MGAESAGLLLGQAFESFELPGGEVRRHVRELAKQKMGEKGDWVGKERRGGGLVAPHLLLCGAGDLVVPPTTSLELRDSLRALGVKSKSVLYDKLDHAQFVCWKWGASGKRERWVDEEILIADVIDVVTGAVSIGSLDWST